MEWPGRFRLTVALLVLLLALRSASSSSAVVPGAGGVARHVGMRSLAGRPMAPEANRADLHVSHAHDEDAITRASAHDAKGTDTREFARIDSWEEVLKKKLRIAVPHKHGFQAFVNITYSNTKEPKITGYSIDVFKTALAKLKPSTPQYEFCVFDGTYDELVGNVSRRVFDAAVGDVTITAERVAEADFTMPYTQSGLSWLVLSEDSKQIQWIFLKPLTMELWVATVGGFFFTGFVVWMIEHPRNPEYQGSGLRQLSSALYFAFSTITFSHEQIIRSPSSKFVLVVWCFAVLVLVQSYTANLSSMLTAKRLRPFETDLDQLVQRGEYIGYQEGTFVRSFLLQKEHIPKEKIRAFRNQTEYAEALRKGSKNGGVSVIVDENPYLTYFLLDPRNKKEFEMVNRNYRTPGLGFVFPLGSPLVHNLSIAILDLTQGNEVSEIEERWLGRASTGNDSPVADSAPLTLRSFSGLFVITGCVSTLMLLIRVARSVYTRYTRIRGSGLQNSDPEKGIENLGESSALQDDTQAMAP